MSGPRPLSRLARALCLAGFLLVQPPAGCALACLWHLGPSHAPATSHHGADDARPCHTGTVLAADPAPVAAMSPAFVPAGPAGLPPAAVAPTPVAEDPPARPHRTPSLETPPPRR